MGSGGSTPQMFVGFIAFFSLLVRYLSIKLTLSVSELKKKEKPMATLTARDNIFVFLSILLETTWAIGVSSITGHLPA